VLHLKSLFVVTNPIAEASQSLQSEADRIPILNARRKTQRLVLLPALGQVWRESWKRFAQSVDPQVLAPIEPRTELAAVRRRIDREEVNEAAEFQLRDTIIENNRSSVPRMGGRTARGRLLCAVLGATCSLRDETSQRGGGIGQPILRTPLAHVPISQGYVYSIADDRLGVGQSLVPSRAQRYLPCVESRYRRPTDIGLHEIRRPAPFIGIGFQADVVHGGDESLRHGFPPKLQKPHTRRGFHTSNEQILSDVVREKPSTQRPACHFAPCRPRPPRPLSDHVAERCGVDLAPALRLPRAAGSGQRAAGSGQRARSAPQQPEPPTPLGNGSIPSERAVVQ